MLNEKKIALIIDPINPILIPNKTLEIGSFLQTDCSKLDSTERHLVRSTFTLSGASPTFFELSQPPEDHPFAKLTMRDAPPDSPLITKLQITAIYTGEDGVSFAAMTNLFWCTSKTLERDDQALLLYGADQNVYFVDMSVDGQWQFTNLGSQDDLDPNAEILVDDGTVATWIKPENPHFIWCYVLNMQALSATRPPSKK